MKMTDELAAKYIRLSIVPGFGVVSQNKLIKMCGNIDNCFEISPEELLLRDKSSDKDHKVGISRLKKFIEFRNSGIVMDRVRSVLEDCKNSGTDVIPLTDSAYPKCFKELFDMPILLYVKGKLRRNEFKRSVGIVGARRCSIEGKKKAIALTERELQNHSVIISGMAKGIDSYTHTAALLDGGYTIAVLGNGPDICYPKEHEMLYEEIVERRCVLSEYPPGTNPRGYMFPNRNRLIAALSDMVYVIDTGRHSGTESTVKACNIYGRRVISQNKEDVLRAYNT